MKRIRNSFRNKLSVSGSPLSSGEGFGSAPQPVVEEWTNGVTLIGKEFVGLDTAISVGIPFGLCDHNVEPHLLEHLVFRTRPEGEFSDTDILVEKLGGFYTGATGPDRITLGMKVLHENIERAITLFFGSIKDLNLSHESIRKEKVIVQGEMQQRHSDPFTVLGDLIYDDVLKGTSLHMVSDTISGIQSVSLTDLEKAKKTYLGTKGMHVAIVGPNVRNTMKFVAKVVDELPRVGRNPPRFEIPEIGKVVKDYRRQGFEDSMVTFFATVPGYGSEERIALEVLGNLLVGSVEEYSSSARIFKKLRAGMGQIYHTSGGYQPFSGAGLFEVGVGGVLEKNLHDVKENILRELKRIRRYPVNHDELKLVKRSLDISDRRSVRNSPLAVADDLIERVMSGENVDSRVSRRQMDAVTPNYLRSVASRYLADERLCEITLRAA